MEIFAGEHAYYRLLAFISFKIEMNWRTMKVGKSRHNLLFYGIHTNNYCQYREGL